MGSGAQSLVFCVVFVDHCLTFSSFSSFLFFFAIVFSFLLRFTASDYSFDIFKLFLVKHWQNYLPTMLSGSANNVTYISEIAKFAKKMHSNLCKFLVLKIVIRIKIFPNEPSIAAITNIIKIGMATIGNSLTNWYLLYTKGWLDKFWMVEFIVCLFFQTRPCSIYQSVGYDKVVLCQYICRKFFIFTSEN